MLAELDSIPVAVSRKVPSLRERRSRTRRVRARLTHFTFGTDRFRT
jgi:hypothetical protein